MSENPYLEDIKHSLPRLLALFDRDPLSKTCGVGDRYFWGWKLIDFGNGTFQGIAHGLARLLKNDVLPECISKTAVYALIDDIFTGTDFLCRKNGSMEEALPYESSFCVTALVAYDLLTTIELLDTINPSTRDHYLEIIEPMIKFLLVAEEQHAFISNHLATAAAALFKWDKLVGSKPAEQRAKDILKQILDHQSTEGWFREYEGADPGYQSLCCYYLADIHQYRPDLQLLEPLRRSIVFLSFFAHPDGSFGGLYGSRNTRFYYPAGIEALSNYIPEAKALALFMRQSILRQKVVGLLAMDEPNITPMFNSFCWAAVLLHQQGKNVPEQTCVLPQNIPGPWIKHFHHAGLIIGRQCQKYLVISAYKGGVCYCCDSHDTEIDCGVLAVDQNNVHYTTQGYQKENEVTVNDTQVTIISFFSKYKQPLPTPARFILLRLLSLTIMKNVYLCNLVKKLLVKLLITGQSKTHWKNKRTITWQKEISIHDEFVGKQSDTLKYFKNSKAFSVIHMASKGYWQRQDTEL